jgi:hypothetical protein
MALEEVQNSVAPNPHQLKLYVERNLLQGNYCEGSETESPLSRCTTRVLLEGHRTGCSEIAMQPELVVACSDNGGRSEQDFHLELTDSASVAKQIDLAPAR